MYLVWLGIYRLYFNPIAHIPGPKLAALTKLYQFYYDVLRGGEFSFKLQGLHAKYGPVIRVNPDEVYKNDPEFSRLFILRVQVLPCSH